MPFRFPFYRITVVAYGYNLAPSVPGDTKEEERKPGFPRGVFVPCGRLGRLLTVSRIICYECVCVFVCLGLRQSRVIQRLYGGRLALGCNYLSPAPTRIAVVTVDTVVCGRFDAGQTRGSKKVYVFYFIIYCCSESATE